MKKKPSDTGLSRDGEKSSKMDSAETSALDPAQVQKLAPVVPAKSVRSQRTLRRRLLYIVATLLLGVGVVVGVVSVVLSHNLAIAQLESNLRSTISRADLGIRHDPNEIDNYYGSPPPRLALSVPGQGVGTIAAIVGQDKNTSVAFIATDGSLVNIPGDQAAALVALADDNVPKTVNVAGYGDYLALAVPQSDFPGVSVIIGLPLNDVETATVRLGWTIALVTLGGLAIALVIGSWVIRRALSPLAEVTSTARRVAEMPLARGDVALPILVAEEDERTEVGKLGAAFNRMLGHISRSLEAREQSEQKVRSFVADASHELRTPLASIRGYAELTRLHGGELSKDVSHAIGRIEAESLRMTDLVDDLLLLARLDEGRELDSKPVNLAELLVDAVGDAQVTGSTHNWSVAVSDEGPFFVSGDEGRLRQVFVNLLANARVHTPEGTSVEARMIRAESSVVVSITDDGPGIPEELRIRLFERFVRGDASRSRIAGSTGLGLSIARAVIEAHHGEIHVESEPGRTSFTLTIPAVKMA